MGARGGAARTARSRSSAISHQGRQGRAPAGEGGQASKELGNAELLGGLPRLHQQARGLGARDAELALERDLAVLGRHRHAHPQRQLATAAGLLEDLLELVLAVEREAAHAELGKRPADRRARLTGCMKCR